MTIVFFLFCISFCFLAFLFCFQTHFVVFLLFFFFLLLCSPSPSPPSPPSFSSLPSPSPFFSYYHTISAPLLPVMELHKVSCLLVRALPPCSSPRGSIWNLMTPAQQPFITILECSFLNLLTLLCFENHK